MSEKHYCPKCHGDMLRREGKHGSFYGCSNYPKCTYTSKKRFVDHVHANEFRDGQVVSGDFNTRKG